MSQRDTASTAGRTASGRLSRSGSRRQQWAAMVLCGAVLAAWLAEHLVPNRPVYAQTFAPAWLPLAAVAVAAAGIMLNARCSLPRLQRVLSWAGLLLMVWAAGGLPIDLLRVVGLAPREVDWPGLITRTLALAAAVMLARHALRQTAPALDRAAAWYGYVAFGLALPYPILRTCWALGGTLGLKWPGAAGEGFVPWLACIPWLLAATLSLLLVSSRQWLPRRLLLAAGWSATAVVATVGPAACWSLATALVARGGPGLNGIATWVPCLFYGSWLLWAIAIGAATHSYQLRSSVSPLSGATWSRPGSRPSAQPRTPS